MPEGGHEAAEEPPAGHGLLPLGPPGAPPQLVLVAPGQDTVLAIVLARPLVVLARPLVVLARIHYWSKEGVVYPW